jgi:hypothetical protein
MNTSYNCAQPDLYLACRNGWQLCKRNLAVFAAKKPKYTDALIAENLEAINAADLLPDVNARYTDYDLARLAIDACNNEILANFDLLTSYINDAFEVSQLDIMYRAAGKAFVAKARKDDWSSVSSLLNAAIPFIEKYMATLETTVLTPSVKNNMPPAFLTEFKDLQARFNAAYEDLQHSDKTGANKTVEKIAANNAIYRNVMAMFKDAQLIFSNDNALKDQFTFVNVLGMARGTKQAGIAGFVTDDETGNPLVGATIAIKGTQKSTTSNDKGRFEIAPLLAGVCAVTVTAKDFVPQTFNTIEIKSGSMTRLNVVLEPVGVLEPA